jgi:hypothetical protein
MAQITDVGPDLQRYAKTIPAGLLGRLAAAELQVRCAYANQLNEAATAQALPEQSRYLFGHARLVLKSLPVAEYVRRARELEDLAGNAPRTLQRDDSGNVSSIAGAYEAMRRDLADKNAYPAGLASKTIAEAR